jgi:glucose uptake protein GlcU
LILEMVYGVIALAVIVIGVMIFRQAAKEGAK